MNAMKRKLPLGAVAVFLVLVLASIGLVYGNWTQSLQIGGTITTGAVSAEWNEPATGNPLCDDSELGKDVAQTRLFAEGKTLRMVIENGYPNYIGDCQPEINYTGQVPGVIEKINFNGKGLECEVLEGALTGSIIATCFEPPVNGNSILTAGVIGEPAPAGVPAVKISYLDGLCTQLTNIIPDNKSAGSLIIEILKGAAEKTVYEFNIEIEVVQWDKTSCD